MERGAERKRRSKAMQAEQRKVMFDAMKLDSLNISLSPPKAGRESKIKRRSKNRRNKGG